MDPFSIAGFLWSQRKFAIPALLVVVICALAFLSHYRLKERDEAIAARVVAEQQLEASQRIAAAKIQALQQTMEEADERNKFVSNIENEITRGRKDGDGPLAPVLRSTVRQLRQRQAGH